MGDDGICRRRALKGTEEAEPAVAAGSGTVLVALLGITQKIKVAPQLRLDIAVKVVALVQRLTLTQVLTTMVDLAPTVVVAVLLLVVQVI